MFTISFPIICASVGIIFAVYIAWKTNQEPNGDSKMQKIARAIQEGAKAYLNRQYRTVAVVAIIIAILIAIFINWTTVIGFVVGAIASALAGYVGMNVVVRAN